MPLFVELFGRDIPERLRPQEIEYNDLARSKTGDKLLRETGFMRDRIDLLLQRIDDLGLGYRRESIGVSREIEAVPRIGGKNEDGVTRGDLLLVIQVSNFARIEQLQQIVADVRVRFFDLIEEQHRNRIASKKSCQPSRSGIAIRFIESKERKWRFFVRVARQVEPFKGAAECRGDLFRKKGLADSRRTREEKDGLGTATILTMQRAEQGFFDRLTGAALSFNFGKSPFERLSQPKICLQFAFDKFRMRNRKAILKNRVSLHYSFHDSHLRSTDSTVQRCVRNTRGR